MAVTNNDEITLRQYLLRHLSEADQQAVELRLLADEAFSQELEIVEDELVDEYVAGKLSSQERETLEQNFLRSAEGISRKRFGEALDRHFKTQPIDEKKPSWSKRFQSFLASATLLRVATAATAAVVLVGAFWMNAARKIWNKSLINVGEPTGNLSGWQSLQYAQCIL